jgi:hypothetical protein
MWPQVQDVLLHFGSRASRTNIISIASPSDATTCHSSTAKLAQAQSCRSGSRSCVVCLVNSNTTLRRTSTSNQFSQTAMCHRNHDYNKLSEVCKSYHQHFSALTPETQLDFASTLYISINVPHSSHKSLENSDTQHQSWATITPSQSGNA